MAETRRGRGSRRSQTRQQLLDAAAEVVAEKGFAGASLGDIAERAGLTTGAVYSNFRSKEALLLELVTTQLDAGTRDVPSSVAEIMAEARAAAAIVDDPRVHDVVKAQAEVFLLGLRDPKVREELQRREAGLAGALATVLEGVDGTDLEAPTPTLPQLAELFFATLQGLQQHRLMFPELLPPAVFEWWTATILKAAADAAGGPAARSAR